MAAGLLRAVHNLQTIPHAVMMVPTSGSALGDFKRKSACKGQGRRVENSWILLNPLVSQPGETEAAVTHFTDILIFCRVLGTVASPVGEIKNTWAWPYLKSLHLNYTIMIPYSL